MGKLLDTRLVAQQAIRLSYVRATPENVSWSAGLIRNLKTLTGHDEQELVEALGPSLEH